MQFAATELPGVVDLALDRLGDERGFFARTWCQREAEAAGLRGHMVQDSVGHNAHQHTLRGLHYHADGFAQVRVVRCIAGSAFVTAVDLRRDTPTHCRHLNRVLDATGRQALYIPPGVALGYLTLRAETDIYYQMTEYFDPQYERGVRWNDPAFGIDWPVAAPQMNPRDANYPDYPVRQ